MTEFTRRKVFGVAAGTVATAVTPAESKPAPAKTTAKTTAPAPEAINETDLARFVKVSAALTGIAEAKLAPSVDPIQVKREYYKRAKADPAFGALMDIVRNTDPANPTLAAEKIMGNVDPAIRYLGRSIILAWYLGVWHAPAELEGKSKSPPAAVVSGTAYTQGWTWRVAQTHPMGYSELRFGYWADPPLPLDDFIKG
jgi:hypothetical protein